MNIIVYDKLDYLLIFVKTLKPIQNWFTTFTITVEKFGNENQFNSVKTCSELDSRDSCRTRFFLSETGFHCQFFERHGKLKYKDFELLYSNNIIYLSKDASIQSKIHEKRIVNKSMAKYKQEISNTNVNGKRKMDII